MASQSSNKSNPTTNGPANNNGAVVECRKKLKELSYDSGSDWDSEYDDIDEWDYQNSTSVMTEEENARYVRHKSRGSIADLYIEINQVRNHINLNSTRKATANIKSMISYYKTWVDLAERRPEIVDNKEDIKYMKAFWISLSKTKNTGAKLTFYLDEMNKKLVAAKALRDDNRIRRGGLAKNNTAVITASNGGSEPIENVDINYESESSNEDDDHICYESESDWESEDEYNSDSDDDDHYRSRAMTEEEIGVYIRRGYRLTIDELYLEINNVKDFIYLFSTSEEPIISVYHYKDIVKMYERSPITVFHTDVIKCMKDFWVGLTRNTYNIGHLTSYLEAINQRLKDVKKLRNEHRVRRAKLDKNNNAVSTTTNADSKHPIKYAITDYDRSLVPKANGNWMRMLIDGCCARIESSIDSLTSAAISIGSNPKKKIYSVVDSYLDEIQENLSNRRRYIGILRARSISVEATLSELESSRLFNDSLYDGIETKIVGFKHIISSMSPNDVKEILHQDLCCIKKEILAANVSSGVKQSSNNIPSACVQQVDVRLNKKRKSDCK